MNKEEYIEYVENNKETKLIVETNSNVYGIIDILIKKGICTIDEFEKTKQKCKEKYINSCYANEKKENLEALKTINNFMNVFANK